MVRERNDRSTHAQNHTRVNFAMRVRNLLSFLSKQVLQLHRNHSGFFFFDVQKLDKTFLTTSFEIPSATFPFLVEDLLDVPLTDF